MDAGEDGEGELIEKVVTGAPAREVSGELNVYDLAKRRFNIDKDEEVRKMKKELDELANAAPINLFEDDE